MRSPLSVFIFLLICQALSAQEAADTLRGRIVNGNGDPVEYVHIGIPSQKLGTISTRDGQFELVVPRSKSGTVEFHHVSYQTYYLPADRFSKNLTIALSEQELTPALVYSGKVREKYLIKRGLAILSDKVSAAGVFLPPKEWNETKEHGKSGELGSVANVKHHFRVEEIAFPMLDNSIPDCVVSFSIYKVSDHDSVFENVLSKPIYVRIPLSKSSQLVTVHPGEDIVLEPGRYFFGVQVVDYDRNAYDGKNGLTCRLYFQGSYYRETPVAKMERYPVNIGLSVKGKEFL